MKRVAFYTLGCKVNQYETEAMAELFEKDGYVHVDSEQLADVYVINTCTVTHMSDRKSRQYIRKIKKKNPGCVVCVVGCYSQVSPEEILDIEGVNLVMGTQDRREIVSYVRDMTHEDKLSTVDDIMKVKRFEELEVSQVNKRTRAFIKIQDGCDRYCTYCIIPYARGRVRSRDIDSIVKEVEKLAENGYREVVLTGIHVASYGKDLGYRVNILDVLKRVDEIEKIERVRLSSVEPPLFTEEFIREISSLKKLCHHFHLSLQSGSDATLKRMNRRYTADQYRKACCDIRAAFDDASLTTDIIVGFPGETHEEFKETLAFLEDIALTDMHVFKYSPRKGTPAADMKNQVDPSLKHMRSERLISLARKGFRDFASDYVGRDLEVLFEERSKDGMFEGHTRNYMKVRAACDEDISGLTKMVRIESVGDDYLHGNLI